MALRFVADRMLGRLAKQLRMLGYDTVYYRGRDFRELMNLAREEERVVLTRNTLAKKEGQSDRIVLLIEDNPSHQLTEIVQKQLISRDESLPFSRCLVCNTVLDSIQKSDVAGKVPDYIFHQMKAFYRCGRCEKIYWQGSHHENMEKRVDALWNAS